MKRMKAQFHKTKGSGGVPVLKVQCLHGGEIISADCCRLRYCKASRGYKEYFDNDGVESVEVACGFEDIGG